MKRARLWTLAAALCATACATAPSPRQPSIYATSAEVAELRAALENTTLRNLLVDPPPKVDIDAAISIPIPEHHSIRSALAYFTTGLKPDIQQSLTRSASYRKFIDRVLEESKLPKGLAYLPVIESAYLQRLTSRAGARGMWQFMPETAREYGLRVDWWIDQRADPDLSTYAAASYLKDLYRDFQDWPLALAAYNAGAARIHRALEETRSSTFWELLEQAAIPKETRGYVPTFFASLMIVSDPAAYGFQLTDPIDVDVKRVGVEGPLSLKFVAEAANVNEGLLRELNPMLSRGIVPPGRTTIRVPAATVQQIAAISKNDDPYVSVCTYTVRDRDTIKRLAKTIGTTPATILAMNGLRKLRHGESIYLPVRATELSNLLSGRRKARPGEHTLTGGM